MYSQWTSQSVWCWLEANGFIIKGGIIEMVCIRMMRGYSVVLFFGLAAIRENIMSRVMDR